MGILELIRGFKDDVQELFATEPCDYDEFFGRTTTIQGKKVEIKSVEGMRFKPTHFLINGKHEVSILRFLREMHGAKDITDEDIEKFESIEYHVEKKDTPHGKEER